MDEPSGSSLPFWDVGAKLIGRSRHVLGVDFTHDLDVADELLSAEVLDSVVLPDRHEDSEQDGSADEDEATSLFAHDKIAEA